MDYFKTNLYAIYIDKLLKYNFLKPWSKHWGSQRTQNGIPGTKLDFKKNLDFLSKLCFSQNLVLIKVIVKKLRWNIFKVKKFYNKKIYQKIVN